MEDEEKTRDQLLGEVKMLRWLVENAKSGQDELARMEEALRDGERTLAACFNSNSEPVMITSPEGKIIGANEACAGRLGKETHELEGASLADLFPRDVAEERLARIGEAVSTLRPVQFRDVCRDRYFDNCAYPVVDEEGRVSKIIIISADTTEKRSLETALDEADRKYRRTCEIVSEGIFQAAPDGHFVSVNNALARMLGYASPEDLIRSIVDIGRQHFVDPERRSEFLRVLNEDGVVYNFEAPMFRKDKTTMWVSINTRAVRDRTGILYFEGAVRDITRRKRLEAQLVQSQKTEAIGRLAGGLAHNFNNILTAIMGNFDLLFQMPELSHIDTRETRSIHDSIGQAMKLCDQLLGLGRRQVIRPVETDLKVAVEGMEDMLKYLLGEDMEYDMSFDEDARTVKVDPSLLEQIILILAENARDAMPGGGKLKISARNGHPDRGRLDTTRINPHLEVKEYVELSISDTGKGIDPEVLDHIFEPFFSMKHDRAGIGLSIVHGIVAQSGGHIVVDTRENAGTTFRVYLPVFRPEEKGEERLPPRQNGEAASRNATVLVVEDESGILYWVTDVLAGMGYKVLSAFDADEAFNLLAKEEGAIDLLLTDIVLPGTPGNELAEMLKITYPDMKVILMSGYIDDRIGDVEVLKKKSPFLSKPFTPLLLLMKVKEVLGS